MPRKTETIEACGECGHETSSRTRKFCARCEDEVEEFYVDWTTWGRGLDGVDLEFCETCGRELVDGVKRFLDGEPMSVTTQEDIDREVRLLRRRLDMLTPRAVPRGVSDHLPTSSRVTA